MVAYMYLYLNIGVDTYNLEITLVDPCTIIHNLGSSTSLYVVFLSLNIYFICFILIGGYFIPLFGYWALA